MILGQRLEHRLHECGTSWAQGDALIAIECLPEHSIEAAVPSEQLAQAVPFVLELRVNVFDRTLPCDMPPSRLLQQIGQALFGALEMVLDRRGRQAQAVGDFRGGQALAHATEQDTELIGSA